MGIKVLGGYFELVGFVVNPLVEVGQVLLVLGEHAFNRLGLGAADAFAVLDKFACIECAINLLE